MSEKESNLHINKNIKPIKDSYSREELESYLFQLAEHYAMTSTKSDIEDFNNWIEQNL